MPQNDNGWHDSLIDALVADLSPVRPRRPVAGALQVALAAAVTALVVVGVNGMAENLVRGTVSPLFLLANGLLLLLGVAASASTIAMANPRVGSRHGGARWAMLMAGVFPAAAILMLAMHRAEWPHLLGAAEGWHCFAEATLASLLTGGALLFWLRRGAPVSPNIAGLHLGVGSTALGSAIYGISCPVDMIYHLGIWHALPVVLGGLAGRFLIPKLLRW
jgi:hypothetical protein